MTNGFKKLKVWQESHELVIKIYNLARNFPDHELYCLGSQIRRAAISIPSNIAEGNARSSKKDYLRFLYISRGSLEEVKYQVILANDLGYLSLSEYEDINSIEERVGRLLNGLIKKVKSEVV